MDLNENNSHETIRIGEQTLVIAGMATMPSRLESFSQALNSILPQVDHLFLFLDRFEQPYVAGDPKVTVITSQRFGDLRANGKLMGLNMAGPEAYYFCVDDDIVYPPDYVSRMVSFLQENNNQVIATVHGSTLFSDFKRYYGDRNVLHRSAPLDTAARMHVGGTCSTAFFTGSVQFDVRNWQTLNMVDLNFALEAKRAECPIIAIPRSDGWLRCLAELQEDSIFVQLRSDDSQQTELAKKLIATN